MQEVLFPGYKARSRRRTRRRVQERSDRRVLEGVAALDEAWDRALAADGARRRAVDSPGPGSTDLTPSTT